MTYLGQTGMVCSVGLGVAAASAAMRAGMAKFDELPYADRRGRPIVGASVPGLGFRLRRGERLVEMMALAIADCLGEKPAFPLREVPLLVGLAEPGRPAGGGSTGREHRPAGAGAGGLAIPSHALAGDSEGTYGRI